jgi:hypothetical protein
MHRYRIIISGGLGVLGREAFGSFQIESFRIESKDTRTVLTGDLDQAGLYSALNRIQALGLELVGLTRVADG